MMHITQHAAERWRERFPDLDMNEQIESATCRIGRKMRIKIKSSCPRHTRFCTRAYKGRYFKMTKERIVFVIAGRPGDQRVVTVLDFRRGCQAA